MTLNVLITGQVRDEVSFRLLCNSLALLGPGRAKIAFAAWTDEILKARKIASDIEGLALEYVDCGSVLPVAYTLNRNITSFLAQYQQLIAGMHFFNDSQHVVRIRADVSKADQLPAFLAMIQDVLAQSDMDDRSLVLGAGIHCLYFIEDRIMILCQRHRQKLFSFRMSDLFWYDPHNVFPEFLFYSMMMDATPEAVGFEYLFGAKSSHQALADYRAMYFGDQFGELMTKYVSDFEDNFSFLRDKVADQVQYDMLRGGIIPDSYHITTLLAFQEGWRDVVSSHSEHIQGKFVQRSPHEARDLKKYLFSLEMKYASAKNAELVREFKEVKNYGCFQDRADDLFGCSLYVIGRADSAYKFLVPLFKKGMRGFEMMYYLIAAAKKMGEAEMLESACNEYLRVYTGNARATAHVEAVRSQ
jgi:hypothetical protein